ncbi:MAG: G5 domain-containing protein, partial [Chloroflexota bacterium]
VRQGDMNAPLQSSAQDEITPSRYNYRMKAFRWLIPGLIFLLAACQPQTPLTLTVIDGDQMRTVQTNERIPLLILTESGVAVDPNDRVFLNGTQVPLDQPALLTPPVFDENGGNWRGVLEIRHPVELTLTTPAGLQIIRSTALTVGEALSEAGIQLYASDFLDPPASTYINHSLTINHIPSREFTVHTSSGSVPVRSTAGTVGGILAEAGLPLIGLDYSSPSENEAAPEDGQIRVVRVRETVTLALEPIPYETELIQSTEIPLGEQEIVQLGQDGLTATRVRIRYEDGEEVSRIEEEKSVISQPTTRIMKTGSVANVSTINVDGETLQYWRAFEMYATIYSPCNSGTGGCSYGTASGLRAGRGVVAVDPSMYSYLQGQRVYIPGYGYAVIGDIGGGYIIEDLIGVSRYRWIDLGFDDNNIVDMSGWLTVYFLAPVPPSIPPAMQ